MFCDGFLIYVLWWIFIDLGFVKACGGGGGWVVGCKFSGSGGFSVVLGCDFRFYGGSMVVESCRGVAAEREKNKKMSRYEK